MVLQAARAALRSKAELLAGAVHRARTWVDPNGRNLAGRLWEARRADRRQVQRVLATGLAQPEKVAERLETKLAAHGNYAAERLARTEFARSHGEMIKQLAAMRPEGMGVQWLLADAHTGSDICDERAQNSSPGLPPGVYRSGEEPPYPGHPNCICLLSPYSLFLHTAQA